MSQSSYSLRGLRLQQGDGETSVDRDVSNRQKQLGIACDGPDIVLIPAGSRSSQPGVADSAVQVDESHVVTVAFDDGFRLLMTGEDFRKEFLESGAPTSRGGDDEPGTYQVPRSLPDGPASEASRGIDSLIAKIIISPISGKATKGVALKMAGRFEDFLVKGLEPSQSGALKRCELHGPLKLTEGTPKSDQPILLFVHGTAANTVSSFGHLWEKHPQLLSKLNTVYREAWAFEHRTLTHSPVRNLLALVESLPKNATLHIVTHSRGGLIAEALCRGQRVGTGGDKRPKAFDALDLTLFPKDSEDGRGTDQELLKKLNTLLRQKNLKVDRFVRVGCPALGSTLASGRLDRWFSFALYGAQIAAIGCLFLKPWLIALNEFARAFVRQRTDPKVLPGLAAQMPGSSLVRMLNREDVLVESDLTVVAGSREGGNLAQRVLRWMPDLYFGGENDLTVNTGSMFGGAERVKLSGFTADGEPEFEQRDCGTYFQDSGPGVSHFRYFQNLTTAERIVERLRVTDARSVRFESWSQELVKEPTRSATVRLLGGGGRTPADDVPTGEKPVVVVLPGIMGSVLSVDGSRVWVSLSRLMFGGLSRLKIDVPRAAADDLLGDVYGDICRFLGNSHDVIRFPFDWRRSVQESADRLKDRLESILAVTEHSQHEIQQPIRFLAHSMGGLVLASLIAKYPDLWKRLSSKAKPRIVLLGTPLEGSWSIVQMLFGRDDVIDKLTMLDMRSSASELLEIISQFPGVLELLPSSEGTGQHTCFDQGTWEHWRQDVNPSAKLGSLPVPKLSDLRQAAETVKLLQGVPWSSLDVAYVAGTSSETVARAGVTSGDADSAGHVEIHTTGRGDGRVLWEIGLLNGVRRWFMDVEHGDLASHAPAFPAIRELLQFGHTTELSERPPGPSRGGSDVTRRIVDDRPSSPMFPTTESLAFSAVGSRRHRPTRSSWRQLEKIQVSVVHADLLFARHPVAVGHYYGDPIIGPEETLDRAFDGALTRRQALGMYAGEIGTSQTWLSTEPTRRPRGVVVVGLGRAGTLTASRLERSFARAIQEYALVVAETNDGRFDDAVHDRRCANISTLLIGTGADSIPVNDAVEAMLRGLQQAQLHLQEIQAQHTSGSRQRVEITAVEFVDLYFDRALAAYSCLQELTERPELAESFRLVEGLRSRGGAQKRLAVEDARGWWHRLQIMRDQMERLQFVELTRRARAEVRLLPAQTQVVQDLIEDTIERPAMETQICRTLFEMLLPNALKETGLWTENLQLVLDPFAAAIPWEMIIDRNSHSPEPPAVTSGLLRQLHTRHFRERPVEALQNIACVIGDPVGADGKEIGDFPRLPGAVQEAKTVTELLRDSGYHVESVIEAAFGEIFTAIHRQEYRILHLAGHGVHDLEASQEKTPGEESEDDDRMVSGMLVGNNNRVFRPQDVEQMRVIPDLVFINCCTLGRTTGRNHGPQFAANIATQFIRMGVRAVVAAGWDVNDAAALTFATKFYDEILRGRTFGEAVQQARRRTWSEHQHLNTWGAYQCYGDPGWRLEQPRDVASETRPGYRQRKWNRAEEVVIELQNLKSWAAASMIDQVASLQEELRELDASIPDDLKNRADVLGHLGLAWSELGDFVMGREYLEKSLTMPAGEVPSGIIQSLCDCRNRLAERPDATGDNVWKKALAWNERTLRDHIRVAPTASLHMTLRSVYRRRAMFLNGEKRFEELEKALKHADIALSLSRTDTPAPVGSNEDHWVEFTMSSLRTVRSILAGAPDRKMPASGSDWLEQDFDPRKVLAWCDEAEVLARQRADEEPSFWESSWQGGYPLLKLLLLLIPSTRPKWHFEPPSPDTLERLLEEIRNGYMDASHQGASPRERSIIVQHLNFVTAILTEPQMPLSTSPRTVTKKQRADYRDYVQKVVARLERVSTELQHAFQLDS